MITDDLILRSLKGETTEAEQRALGAWRRRSPDNEARYRQVARLWEMRRLFEPTLHAESPPTAAEILDRAGRPTARSTAPPRTGLRRILRAPSLRAAAALPLLLGGAALLGYLARQTDDADAPRTLELVTAAAEMTSARLPDGSVVRLGPDSRLQVEITPVSRQASLHGRAYFAVAHDPGRPFTVRTHAGEVEVKGTRFDLEARSGELELVVVDGSVRLAADGESVDVGAGQRSRVGNGTGIRVEAVEDVYGGLAWVGGFVAFESTPLREVARELERRYGMDIQIRDSLLAEQTVTSWSLERSPEDVLRAVCLALDAFCTITDSLTTVER